MFGISNHKGRSRLSAGKLSHRGQLRFEQLEQRQLLSITPMFDPSAFQALVPLDITESTGEKPQSKVWEHDDHWWSVLPESSGTWLWRLDDTSWNPVLQLSPLNDVQADIKAAGDLAFVFLYNGTSSQFQSLEYLPGAEPSYQPWSLQPGLVDVALSSGVETATIDLDSTGRLWLASDSSNTVEVRYADVPYTSFSSPITVASEISSDDIAAVTALDGDKIGVFWSSQIEERFGFRTHEDGADPTEWSDDEMPGLQSMLSVGNGLADDHLNLAVASDGTLYAAVKTSFDDSSQPKIGLLVRHPSGDWGPLYTVDNHGTRPIVVLNEEAQRLFVFYTESTSGGDIVYRESAMDNISFTEVQTLLSGNLNDVSSTKDPFTYDLVVIASKGSSGVGAHILPISSASSPPETANNEGVLPEATVPADGLVGHWQLDELQGSTAADASGLQNDGTVAGNPLPITGQLDNGLQLDGSDYLVVSDDSSLDFNQGITLSVWVRPETRDTQYVLKKARHKMIDGFELSLSGTGKMFVRFNEDSARNDYRLDSSSSYPTDGQTWVHLAATYDGATIRLYVNGQLESTRTANFQIATNNVDLGIGAQDDGYRAMQGGIDETRIYNRALNAEEIQALFNLETPPPPEPPSEPDPIVNEAPQVYAGADRLVEQDVALQLLGTVSDDGLPDPPATVATQWTVVSGPGTASFADTSAGQTSVTFSTPGNYVLRLSGNDGQQVAVDDVAVEVTAATPPDPVTLPEATVPADGLVGHWQLDELQGSTAADASGLQNDGTVAGNPLPITGQLDNGLQLDGSDYLVVSDDSSLDFNQGITLSVWVRPETRDTQYVLKKARHKMIDGFELSLSGTGKMFVRFNEDSARNDYRLDSSSSYPTDGQTWVHLAATYDGATIRLYVNGQLESTRTANFQIATNNVDLGIGAQDDGYRAMQGGIDETRIYNRALNAEEIQALASIV